MLWLWYLFCDPPIIGIGKTPYLIASLVAHDDEHGSVPQMDAVLDHHANTIVDLLFNHFYGGYYSRASLFGDWRARLLTDWGKSSFVIKTCSSSRQIADVKLCDWSGLILFFTRTTRTRRRNERESNVKVATRKDANPTHTQKKSAIDWPNVTYEFTLLYIYLR